MKTAILLCVILLSGCSMSAEEQIKAHKACHSIGMDGEVMAGVFHNRVMEVRCVARTAE